MAESSLQDRLRDHAKAFDGLLSLIPAKMYYGEDNSDQWKKEKQTKQEAAAARRAKLDPDSALNRNAKEVMDERAKNKRKLRQLEQEEPEEPEAEDEDYEPVDGVEAERPLEGLKKKTLKSPQKKQKTDEDAEAENNDNKEVEEEEKEEEEEEGAEDEEEQEEEEENDDDDDREENGSDKPKLSKSQEKRAAKREKKAEKRAEKRAEKKAKRTGEETQTPVKGNPQQGDDSINTPGSKKQKGKKAGKDVATPSKPQPSQPQAQNEQADETLAPSLDFSRLQKEDEGSAASAADSEPHSPTFDLAEASNGPNTASTTELASTTTSISSTVPPSEKPKHLKIPADTTALRARLAAKIEALRAARKADGTNGKPIRTRQELIESRRAKEAQRKEHKKELRRLAKVEEERKREEALASNSPSVVMSPAVDLDETTGNFSFGRVAFADGSQMSHDLSYFLSKGKKKGPSDPKTALLKVQNQKKRLEELDAEKRKDVEEKEAWLTARRRVEGEKIRDDEAMLKKSVKRKETNKKKSEKAWKERASGVAQAQKERQKKREENIKKRREDKLLHRSGKKKKGGASKKKKGGRPGFEGSLGVGGRK